MPNHYHKMSDCCSEIDDHRDGCCQYLFNCMNCLNNTVVCCCLNICCCHCSCIIFPGCNNVTANYDSEQRHYLSFINKQKESVPYIELSTEKSKTKGKVIMYFHGNSQNISEALQIALPIFRKTHLTTLLIEYPNYGSYIANKPYKIADQIMSNSLEFYDRVCEKYNISSKDIYIIGRSIGSGPACHLASQIQNQKLALISPFDTISQVAKEKLGCIGCIIHNHFNNLKAMKNYRGELLVIHGKNDEVISINNAQNLVKDYEGKKQIKRYCKFIQPPSMTHNRYQINDLTDPIRQFFGQN